MRTSTLILSASVWALGVACGPRVSVGDLGAAGAAAASGGGSASVAPEAGGAVATSGAPGSAGGVVGGAPGAAGAALGGAPGAAGAALGGAPGAAGAGGGAGVAGLAGAGDAALPPGCPADLTQFLPPVTATCPAVVPPDGACDVAENAICVWQDKTDPGFTALGCYASITGKEWYGIGQGTLGPIGVNADQCPLQAPDTGSSCSGHEGQICYYPLGSSSCAASGGNWTFLASSKVDTPPREVKRLCAPTGIDETKQVKDLSDAEVAAWCNWYGDPSGAPRPAVAPNDPPGFAFFYGSIYTSMAGVSACILELPATLCAKNLRTQPCTATLAQLDDCIETMRAGFVPGWVGHGCGPLLANSTCTGVLAQQYPQAMPGCSVPIQ